MFTFVRDDIDEQWKVVLGVLGYATFYVGGKVFIATHGEKDGMLFPFDYLNSSDYDIPGGIENATIMCCYPRQVQEKHPNLHIIGDWDGMTKILDQNGVMTIMPATFWK
jgi:hypothetical protein